MDEKKFEQYVQQITDKVYQKLLEREKGAGEGTRPEKGQPACAGEKSAGEIIYSKKLLSEADARELVAMKACSVVCGAGTIITALAQELLEKKGVKLVRK